MSTTTRTATDTPPLATMDSPAAGPGLEPAALNKLSRRTLEQLARSDAWDHDRLEEAALSARRGWAAAGIGAVLAVLGLSAAVLAHRTPPPPPMAVVVDRSTGATQVVSRVTETDVPALAVLDQHLAAHYVRAREGYFPSLLQRDYDAVARMSTPEAFRNYGDRFIGDKAMHKTLGMTQEHRITIVSARPVRLAARTDGQTASGEMVVTFDKEIRSPNQPSAGIAAGTAGPAGTLSRHVATLQYEYRPSAMSREVDRLENPFGFVVTAYRVDAELAAPAAQAAPAVPASPASPASPATTAPIPAAHRTPATPPEAGPAAPAQPATAAQS